MKSSQRRFVEEPDRHQESTNGARLSGSCVLPPTTAYPPPGRSDPGSTVAARGCRGTLPVAPGQPHLDLPRYRGQGTPDPGRCRPPCTVQPKLRPVTLEPISRNRRQELRRRKGAEKQPG